MSKRTAVQKTNQKQDDRMRMISEVFDMFDADGNASIDAEEIESCLTAMGRKPTTEEIQEFNKRVDKDKNGRIAKNEFLTVMNEIYSAPQELVEEVVEAFQVFDRDGSGRVSKKEMKNILMTFGGEAFSEKEVNEIFDLVDTDDDDTISYAEFADIWKFQ